MTYAIIMIRMDLPIPQWLANIGLRLNRAHYRQMMHRLYSRPKPPSWFDHRIDLYYQWPNNMFWLERAILPRRHLQPGCVILDLFCGDGYYSRYFHSSIAGHIDAIDLDPTAIAHAEKLHSHPAIVYKVSDAVKDPFPATAYDVVLWFEAIEHLTEPNYKVVIAKIKECIGDSGVLIGSTPIFDKPVAQVSNWEHENEFESADRLRRFLEADFGDVVIDTTIWPTSEGAGRTTAHFTCRSPR